MNNRNILIGAVILVIVLVIAITVLGSRNQTTEVELLPGTLEPSPTSEQVLNDEPPTVAPAP